MAEPVPVEPETPQTLEDLLAQLDAAKTECARLDDLKRAAWNVEYETEHGVRHRLESNGWELPER